MIVIDSFVRDVARLVVWFPLRYSAAVWPHELAVTLGRGLGTILARGSRRHTSGIIRGLRAVFTGASPKRLRLLGVGCLQHHFINLTQLFRFPWLRPADVERTALFEGLDHLDAALAGGRGVVLVHMHFGTMQFPLMALALGGYAMSQVGRRDPERDMTAIDRHVSFRSRVKLEESLPFRHIVTNESIRPVFRALADNEVVMIPGDGVGGGHEPGRTDRPVRLLGRTVMWPRGPAWLARQTGAALLPLVCILDRHDRYIVRIHSRIAVPRTPSRDADIRHTMADYARLFERYLRACPDHWAFWEEFGSGMIGEAGPPP